MKKRILIFSLLSIFVASITAQEARSEVIYKMSPNENFVKSMTKGKGDLRKNLEKKLSDNFSGIELILKFDRTKSFYTIHDLPMKNEGHSSNSFWSIALRMAHNGDYYKKINKKGSYFEPLDNGEIDFVVFYPDLDWKVAKETKVIQGYTCYKATATREVKNTKGEFKHNVEAWFCPEISLPYGPLNYGGLPGVVLEVDDGISRYTAKEVDLNSEREDKLRENLDEKKVISIEEYNNFSKKRMNRFKEEISGN